MNVPISTKSTTEVAPGKRDLVRDLILKRINLPEIPTKLAKQLDGIKTASEQRAIAIDLAILGLDGRRIESIERDWPGVDLAARLADPTVAAAVDAIGEAPQVQNYAGALQKRRVAQKALGILETAIDADATLVQAQGILELLSKGREIKEPTKPERRLQFSLGQASIETPFGKTTINVLEGEAGETFLSVCRAMYVRSDGEIAAVLDCLRAPMSRVTLGGW
jgi:hypothetical protein